MTENHSANSTARDAPGGWGSQPTRGIFWPSQAIAVGLGWFSDFHHHYATQICISFGAPLRVRTDASGPYTEQRSLIVEPHVPHELETTGIPCFVLWSESRALAALAHHLRITSASELPALPEDLLSVPPAPPPGVWGAGARRTGWAGSPLTRPHHTGRTELG